MQTKDPPIWRVLILRHSGLDPESVEILKQVQDDCLLVVFVFLAAFLVLFVFSLPREAFLTREALAEWVAKWGLFSFLSVHLESFDLR